MKFQITVGQNKKFLFKTDMEACKSPDALARVFAIFLQKFPASEGFYMGIHAYWEESMSLDKDAFIEAIKQGKGKGYIMSLKNKKKRANWMAFLLYRHMEKGVL